ncbi:MAG: helix-turn-helix domain-containing protein [Akkermansia sp.]
MKSNQELTVIKKSLRAKGWSYKMASPFLGVSFSHLSKVMAGLRPSQRLLRRISALPPRKK